MGCLGPHDHSCLGPLDLNPALHPPHSLCHSLLSMFITPLTVCTTHWWLFLSPTSQSVPHIGQYVCQPPHSLYHSLVSMFITHLTVCTTHWWVCLSPTSQFVPLIGQYVYHPPHSLYHTMVSVLSFVDPQCSFHTELIIHCLEYRVETIAKWCIFQTFETIYFSIYRTLLITMNRDSNWV